MEPDSDPTGGDVNNKGQPGVDNKATEETAGSSTAVTPRRGLRERGAPRPRSGGVPAATPADVVNGAAPSPQTSSGRVLRDRSTRAVPAWLKDSKSDDEDEPAAADTGGAAAKRRKVSHSRRKRSVESAGPAAAQDAADVAAAGDSVQTKDSEDSKKPDADAQGGPPLSRRPPQQTRAKAPGARAARGSAKPVCKSEPGTTENPAAGEAEVKDKETNTDAVEKKEEGEDADVSGMSNEGPPFQDEGWKDLDFQVLQTQSGAEDVVGLSSDEEDVPFKDDLNDQSYDPKDERDVPKVKRRAPPRQKERKDKTPTKEKEGEVADIKIEGSENTESVEEEVKLEEDAGEDPDGPRKRGRRRKDDKTPRLPKRRKKPPVQYVRCEMEGCGTVLAHPRYLQHHIKYQHLLKKKYVCPHPSCGRLFRLQKQLLRHAKHHTDQRDYICEFCARAFKSSHNLAVHRMIHTGEKPLQCEICGFTCRQKASLNWHMKKHDADATYQFSCSICGKKFEKKDCVVAHKAKSHPEVLIAEALAANAGALITTPASLLEFQGNPVQAEVTNLEVSQVGQTGHVAQLSQVGAQQQVAQLSQAQLSQMGQVAQQVSHQVVLLGQDQSLHTMQVPVTIALSPIDPPSPHAENQQQTHLQLQMPLQFVQAAQHSQQPQIGQLTLHSSSVVTQQQSQLQQQLQQPPMPMQSFSSQQQQVQGQTQILHMTFQPVSQSQTHIQQIPILAPQQLHTLQTTSSIQSLLSASQAQPQDPSSNNGETYVLDTSVLTSSPSANSLHHQTEVGGEVVWDQDGEVLTDGTVGHVTQVLI